MSSRAADQLADADDEPPSLGPRAEIGAGAPTVLAADRRCDDDATPVPLEQLASLLSNVLRLEGADSGAEASLTLIDAAQIAELKRGHLGGSGEPTDVLSFPIDGGGPRAELVGDVVLCPEVAAAQAPTHAGTLEDELALLVVHGGLHLTGWDHDDAATRGAMWTRERQLLSQLHGLPTNDPWGEFA